MGWGLLLKSKRCGVGGEWTQVKSLSPEGDRLPGAQASRGLDTVPAEQGPGCCAAASMEPGSASSSVPQRGQNVTGTQRSILTDEATEAQDACGSQKM